MSTEIVTSVGEVVQIPDSLPMSLRIPGSDVFVHFRPITEFPGYEASSDGRIWSRRGSRPVAGARGGSVPVILNSRKPLKPFLSGCGYRQVHLWKDNRQYTKNIHRLVMVAFVGEKFHKKIQVCHNNGIRTDNRIENLRYDTAANNAEDRELHGTSSSGDRNYNSSVSDAQAKRIFKDYHYRQLASGDILNKHGISNATLRRIVERRSYKSATAGMKRGRIHQATKGSSSALAKLTEEIVLSIRQKYGTTHFTYSELAVEYGVTLGSIANVVKRKTWRHI